MRRLISSLMIGLALAAYSVAAAEAIRINQLPDSGAVTVSGTVDKVNSEREFVLRDDSGSITVKIAEDESVVLAPGAEATVSGTIKKGLISGNVIREARVKVHKDVASAVSDAMKNAAGISMEKVKAVKIGGLPDSGLVRLDGTVESVKNEKNFRLQDESGAVEVTMQSEQRAALTEGARVSVIGYVKKSLLGKSINASYVSVVENAKPAPGRASPAR